MRLHDHRPPIERWLNRFAAVTVRLVRFPPLFFYGATLWRDGERTHVTWLRLILSQNSSSCPLRSP